MNDQELITAVRRSVDGVRMNVPAEQIVRRSRAIRASGHRRLAACITAVAAAGSVVLGLALSGALGAGPTGGTGTIRTAAFTLTRNANGTATLTVTPQVLLDPTTLQSDLRQYGIPAIVTAGRFCSSDPIPSGFTQVVSGPNVTPSPPPTYTINPAAMPAGTELSFGIEQIPYPPPPGTFPSPPLRTEAFTETFMELIDTNSYTCSIAPSAHPPGNEGASVEYFPGGGWTLIS
jgi:hypothetical protein